MGRLIRNGIDIANSGETPPDPHEHFYLAFSTSDDEDFVASRFKERFGFHPEWIFDSLGNLLAGPYKAAERMMQ